MTRHVMSSTRLGEPFSAACDEQHARIQQILIDLGHGLSRAAERAEVIMGIDNKCLAHCRAVIALLVARCARAKHIQGPRRRREFIITRRSLRPSLWHTRTSGKCR